MGVTFTAGVGVGVGLIFTEGVGVGVGVIFTAGVGVGVGVIFTAGVGAVFGEDDSETLTEGLGLGLAGKSGGSSLLSTKVTSTA